MNNAIGLAVLTLGVGLTAGFGAALSPEFRSSLLMDGQVELATRRVSDTFAAYCNARAAFNLADADGCGTSGPVPASTAAALAQLEASEEVLRVQPTQARVEYRIALSRLLEVEQLRLDDGVQGPGERLTGWASAGGLGFGIGWLLMLVGGWICRGAASAPVNRGADGAQAVDFGCLLDDVHASIAALAEDMAAHAQPTTDDADACKGRLHAIQSDSLARLCGSGRGVQAQYGLEGMAMVFSPLSASERKLNRAWAALVDRHWPEALTSVQAAAEDLADTREALKALQASA